MATSSSGRAYDTKQPRLRDAPRDMQKKGKEDADALAKTLSEFAVVIATKDRRPPATGRVSVG